MSLIVFSSALAVPKEFSDIEQILETNIYAFHLRKPGFNRSEYRDFLKKIPTRLHKKIVLHDHIELLQEFNLKGFYISRKFRSEKNPSINDIRTKHPEIHLSMGCHTIEELESVSTNDYDYLFFSPVFNSISKPDYPAYTNRNELKKTLLKYNDSQSTPIFALGGISGNNIKQARSIGFHHFAVLGALWNSTSPFQKTQEILKQLF